MNMNMLALQTSELITYGIVGVVLIILLLLFFFAFNFINLYIQALVSGARQLDQTYHGLPARG